MRTQQRYVFRVRALATAPGTTHLFKIGVYASSIARAEDHVRATMATRGFEVLQLGPVA
jgi:hypothetical protein